MKQLLRYMIGILGALGVWVMMFGFEGNQQVYAQATSCDYPTSDAGCSQFCAIDAGKITNACDQRKKGTKMSDTLELANTLDQILSVLYLLMWPLMYVAGLAMDNSLIYGEGLGLTGLLYQFWTIMRSIANFMIVFIIVWTIGKEMWKGSGGAAAIGKTLGSIMIAGVLINASWFLIGAMVDVSTIATYGVGALPLKLESGSDAYCKEDGSMLGKIRNGKEGLDDIAKLGNCRPILSSNATINFSDTLSSNKSKRQAFYSYEAKSPAKKHYFLACPFKNNTITAVQRKTTITSFQLTGDNTQAYKDAQKGISDTYCVIGNQLLDLNGLTTLTIGAPGRDDKVVGGAQALHSRGGQRVRTLVESNKNMIGVMYNLYGNILGFANIKNDIQTATTESQIIQFMIKLFFGFAMLFPMIALCIVLMMRVAVLWMVVGFSPLLVLGWTLKMMKVENKQLDSIMDSIGKKLTLPNVVSLLFQPVLIVFVMSMGMMFLDAIHSSMATNQSFGDALQCNKTDQCCSVIGVVDICLEKFNATNGVDAFFSFFTFSIVNIVGVVLLYFMVFAVMKSSEITKDATEKIQGLGRNLMGSMPVIPWFDGGFVGFDGAKEGLGEIGGKIMKETKDTTGDTITKPWVDKTFEDLSGAAGTAKKKIVENVGAGYETKDISTPGSKSNDFGKKLLSEIKGARKDAKYVSYDSLLDTNDTKIKALFDRYNIKGTKTASKLFSNPEFLADQKINASEVWNNLKADAAKTKYEGLGKDEYFKALKEQASGFNSIGGTKGYITTNGKKILFDKIDNKDTKAVEDLKPMNLSIPISATIDDIVPLSDQFTRDEFENLKTGFSIDKKEADVGKVGYDISENTEKKTITIKKLEPKSEVK